MTKSYLAPIRVHSRDHGLANTQTKLPPTANPLPETPKDWDQLSGHPKAKLAQFLRDGIEWSSSLHARLLLKHTSSFDTGGSWSSFPSRLEPDPTALLELPCLPKTQREVFMTFPRAPLTRYMGS